VYFQLAKLTTEVDEHFFVDALVSKQKYFVLCPQGFYGIYLFSGVVLANGKAAHLGAETAAQGPYFEHRCNL
jgi:hypothetical protein